MPAGQRWPAFRQAVIPATAARLTTSAAAVGLLFMGAIVVSVFLVPALILTLMLGLAESRSARREALSAPEPGQGYHVGRRRR